MHELRVVPVEPEGATGSLPNRPRVFISIVSHRQGELASRLLQDINTLCPAGGLTAHVTLNVPEPISFSAGDFSYEMSVSVNREPLGFAANHNAAFQRSSADFFCVMNPDIRLVRDPFPILQGTLARSDIGAVAPLIRDSAGRIQDNARRLPTLGRMIRRFLRGPALEYPIDDAPFAVDWVAGMFMLFPSKVLAAAGGFNERYWLYYEDAELCARLRLAGFRVLLDPRATAVHDARRASRGDLRHLAWHVSSALRFLSSPVYRAARQSRGANSADVYDGID